MRVVVFCFALVTSGVATPFAWGQGDDLVTFARVRNKAAIDSIKSMECRYERILVPPTTLEQAGPPCFHIKPAPGRFWRSGDTFRLIDPIIDGTTREYVARDGKLLVWRGGGPLKTPTLALYTIEPIFGVGGEMWEYLLFAHWDGSLDGAYLFYDIAADPTTYVVHIAERVLRSHNDIHIDLSRKEMQLECWFDSKTNYLIRKMITIHPIDPDGGRFHYEDEVIEFREPAPGVHVPVIIEHRCYKNKMLRSTIRTLITDLKVNHSLAESSLQIPNIAGMKCTDTNRLVDYVVDARGERVGPESPADYIEVAPKPVKEGTIIQYEPPKPSRPPFPWWAWCLIASAAVLLVGILLRIRQAKSRRDQSGATR